MSAGVSDQRMKGQGNQDAQYPQFDAVGGIWSSVGLDGTTSSTYNYFNAWNRGYEVSGFKSVEQGMQNIGLEANPSTQSAQYKDMPTSANSSSGTSLSKKSDQPKETIPKKMTWASVASQPAKPPVRTNSTTSTLKKKGPGMPPPPMVPGKHNMDIGTWDSPSKNPPPLLPPPIPPPIITPPPVSIDIPAPTSQTLNKTQHPTPSSSSSNPQHSQQSHNQQNRQPIDTQQAHQSGSGSNPNSNNNNGPMNNTNNRPNWSHPNDNRRGGGGNHPNHMMSHGQHQMNPYHHQQPHPHHHHQGPHHPHPGHHGQSNYQQQPSHHQPYNQRQHQMHGPPPSLQQTPQQSTSQQMMNIQSGGNAGTGGGNGSYDTLIPHMNSLQLQQQQYQQNQRGLQSPVSNCSSTGSHPVLEKLRDKNNYNPEELDMEKANIARFFVIKSYSEDDIHRSIKYEIWCSTEHGNKRLDQAYREVEKENGIIYLFFSVNGSGHFCGVAQMISPVDYNSNSSVWSQNKWKGVFKVRWIYVKDIPNTHLRHIHLENNENKSVTHSRDTQEVPNVKGQQVLKLIHLYKHTTSIFDDFTHYEKRQEEEDSRKDSPGALGAPDGSSGPPKLGPSGPGGPSPGSSKHNNYDNSSGGSGGNPPRPHYSNYEKSNHYNNSNGGSGNSYEKYGSYSGKNYGYENRNQYNNHRPSGNYHYNYDNRREDRGGREGGSGYDRKDSHDGGNNSSGYYNRDNDFHHNKTHRNSMGGGNSERNDYRDQRRDDNRSFNNRDRQQDGGSGGGGSGGYGNRGGHRDNYRDRGDHHGGGGGRGGRGGNRGGNNSGGYQN